MGSPWPRYDIHYESPGVPDPPPHQGFRDAHMRQVERARAAKARASPLERQRRVCDAWLRVMAMVRELPPSLPASTRALQG